MSNSTTNLDLISASQANKEVSVNALLDAASPAMLYGRRAVTTAGLTWGYYGGTASVEGVPTTIANGTVTLAASATNYVQASPTTGAVSVNTTGFTDGYKQLYSIVTGAGTVTTYTDLRTLGGGEAGGVTSINGQDGDVTLDAADVGADASGTAAAAMSAHAGASDPHPQYLTSAEGNAAYEASGAAAAAMTAHTGASDPHPQYLTQAEADLLYAAGGDGSTQIAAHVAAADPHTQYQKESEKGVANGYASLGADGKVPASQLPTAGSSSGAGLPKLTIVQRVTPQVINSATMTDVSFDTLVQDDVGARNSAAPTVLTVPTGYTRARVTAYTNWVYSTGGRRQMHLLKNGTSIRDAYQSPDSGTAPLHIVTGFITVAAGDTLKIGVVQDIGFGLSLRGWDNTQNPELQIEWYP